MKTFSALLLMGLVLGMVGCGDPFLDELYHTQKRIVFRVGYTIPPPDKTHYLPPLSMDSGDTTISMADVLCSNVQALFPGRACEAPTTYSDMTPILPLREPDGTYKDERLYTMAAQLPAEAADTTTIAILFLDGKRALTDPNDVGYEVTGVAKNRYNNGHYDRIIAVYGKTIWGLAEASKRPKGTTSHDAMFFLFTRSITHEVGHRVGLVNSTASVTPHTQGGTEDPKNAHCVNPQCVMHTGGSSESLFSEWLGDLNVRGRNAYILFDNNCVNDIHASVK